MARICLGIEAAAHLAVAKAAVAAIPFRWLATLIQLPASACQNSPDRVAIRSVCHAVSRVSQLPVRWAVCFPQALAAHWMLRRRGIPSGIRFGVQRETPANLAAHAWLHAGGSIVLGGEVAAEFLMIAEFPAKHGAHTA